MAIDTVIIKQEHLSRENTPFPQSTPSGALQSPNNMSTVEQQRLSTPVGNTSTLARSQQEINTEPNPSMLHTPKKIKMEEDALPMTPVLQDSPNVSKETGHSRRKKRKTRRGKTANDASAPIEPPPMNLTHANKQWFDIVQTKQSSRSIASTIITENTFPAQIRMEQQFNYVKEIFQRSLGWIMLPLRWTLHWAAIYLLPFAIALGFLAIMMYLIFPRFIFTAIPSVLTTATSVLAFPARLVITHSPEIWCNSVGIGCVKTDSHGEEVVRNATFATDLEVRNAFTVIHNLNYLNNSSNRLVLDSVHPPQTSLMIGKYPLCRRCSASFIQLDRSRLYRSSILRISIRIPHTRQISNKTRNQRKRSHGPHPLPLRTTLAQTRRLTTRKIHHRRSHRLP